MGAAAAEPVIISPQFLELYFVPKQTALAVGRRTKVPQKEKKINQIQTANRASNVILN